MSSAAIILFLPLLMSVAILTGLKRSANVSALLSTAASAITFLLSLGLLFKGDASNGTEVIGSWIRISETFSLDITLKLDPLSKGMMIVVTTIGLLERGRRQSPLLRRAFAVPLLHDRHCLCR